MCLPFETPTTPLQVQEDRLLKSITEQTPSFEGKAWKKVSQPTRDFCKGLLTKEPKKRPSAAEALQSDWSRANHARVCMDICRIPVKDFRKSSWIVQNFVVFVQGLEVTNCSQYFRMLSLPKGCSREE